MTRNFTSLSFVASQASEAQEARDELIAIYGNTDPEEADVIVALGGDGFMLQTLHTTMNTGKRVYGMNRATMRRTCRPASRRRWRTPSDRWRW